MGAHSKNTGQKYLPVGINAESWTENMGISHEYHSARADDRDIAAARRNGMPQ